jgi:hypothetical protein
MELEVSEKLGTQVKAIYQLFCVFNFLATTHRLCCDPLLTNLGVGGECITFGTKVPAFSVNTYASPRCPGETVLVTTGVAGHYFALR